MLRDTAIAEVQEGLSFRSDLVDRIIRRMIRVQFLLEMGRSLPWFIVKEAATIPLPVGSAAALPTDFIRELDYGKGMYYLSDSGASVFLRKMAYDEALARWGTSTGEYPVAYVLRTENLQIFPSVERPATLVLDYYARQPMLEANIENNWLKYAPYLIIGHTGLSLARTLQNGAAMAEFEVLAQNSWDAVVKENILREQANRAYILGRNA